jgi:hypothetical protein
VKQMRDFMEQSHVPSPNWSVKPVAKKAKARQ